MIAEPLKCLADAPLLPELGEYELNRLADPPIGMKHDLSQRITAIADGEPLEKFAAAGFGLLARLQPLAYDLQFDDTERPFDAQHQLIVEVIQIIDLLLVGDEGSKDLANFQQTAPV